MDAWNGSKANLLAVVRLKRNRTDGQLAATLLGHRYLNQTNLEDGRLFRDARGRVFLYLSVPMGRYGGARASVNVVHRIYVNCTKAASIACDARMGPARLLTYMGSLAWDKNWVPWNGTSLMAYSHYGTLGPHSVFNWTSYREPVPHTGFDYVANSTTLFSRFKTTYGSLVHLSGGTPAILEPGGQSYLAIGHVRVHPGCLHPAAIPGLSELLGPAVRTNCAHLLKLPTEAKESIPFHSFAFMGPGNRPLKHYHVDYSFFIYRFSATPPFELTHMSHGILPPSPGHFGITFPIGLERFGSDYVIAYGDADQASKLMVLKRGDVERLLVPINLMERLVRSYSICTLPFPNTNITGSK
ncbi:hypothetical protein HYH03_015459 [Edaphochlamys debaryana]|uniref:Uncharacterized protein n=1 Tax=Edaphochlamys debaryana TaxID=47281 RepID=A0A836BQX7_9CHLO|nr:hypothetical protein HYH03_015459 [Edaphochlamys debaryana]|eukprot:KAG2485876.1 hypothetical protein HYH03_015459 [Edaphochlamys debaryana]